MSGGFQLRGTYVQLRGASFRLLTEDGQVLRGSVTSDTGGGGTTLWNAGTATIPCRVEPIGRGRSSTGVLQLFADRITSASTHFVTVPPNTVVSPGDRFLVQNMGTFAVVGAREATDTPLKLIAVADLSS